ncbi:hypothetical protein [Pseudoroseomonas sp. WGS1072]|uniref:hypothetical protein n=1 Tax=Roseomonas sp. WGS1072 TaxID=3366816 RepID=UPI003BF22A28
MRFEILALRPFEGFPSEGYCAEVTLGYADMTISGCRLGHDCHGKPFVAFPKLTGQRARIHVKDGGTRRKMVSDAATLYEQMKAAAETPVAKASSVWDNRDAVHP